MVVLSPNAGAGGANPGDLVPAEAAALTPEQWAVLEALAERRPVTVMQEDLAAATRYSRHTVGECLRVLRDRGLAHRPNGERKGDAITEAGYRMLTARQQPH
jgi:hypothetical protein